MALRNLLTISTLITSALSISPAQAPLVDSSRGPSVRYAKENGIHVFNAVHASMRQWDSSLKHNGMSFFAASIPNNTLLYHGTHTDQAIDGVEWLAFEIEHAEMFARTRGPGGGGPGGGRPGRGPPPGQPGDGDGGPPREREGEREPAEEYHQAREDTAGTAAEGDGYLHIYKTKQPLTKLLYLDGMSAGKTSMGTLDTQDRILMNTTTPPSVPPPPRRGGPFGDYQRAQTMCALGLEYGIEGIIRMEAGFELILCNFSEGVELLSAYQRPKFGTNESTSDLDQLEYIRGVASRYQGITAGRVVVDYSSMVSAFFYPLNLTNPDATRSDLPRLPVDDKDGRARLKSDVLDIFGGGPRKAGIDWQGVVDMIISRYSDRLQFLHSNSTTQRELMSEVNFLLNVFLDYKQSSPSLEASVKKCTNHYLLTVSPTTPSDHLIYAAVQAVSSEICKALFSARSLLLAETDGAVETVKSDLKGLTDYLDWSTWKNCGRCGYDEVCYVAIWPWGGVEDHFDPKCLKNDQLGGRRGYWDMKF